MYLNYQQEGIRGSDFLGATDSICKNITKKVIIIDAVLIVLFFILTKNPMHWVYGLLFSSFFNVLKFRILALNIEKAVNMSPRKAQVYVGANYFLRYILTAVIVVIAFKTEYFNPIAVIIGLLLIKMVILVDNIFVHSKGKSKN
ncbi:MAG: ATP synthase subunit I [Firmicutes bacterium]|nr:ATP synthase subunit I [Bacillota bacterium]